MRKLVLLALVVLLFLFSAFSSAEELKLGRFDGVTLKVCLIGGGAYEKLYEKFFPEFERLTGAKVEIVFKAQHFELDKKLKIDFAAGTADYDLFTNHTSFYTQYLNGTEPLESYFTKEELSDFIPKILDICQRDGHLWTIPRHADISSLYYRTDVFNDPEIQKRFKEQFGRDLEPPRPGMNLRKSPFSSITLPSFMELNSLVRRRLFQAVSWKFSWPMAERFLTRTSVLLLMAQRESKLQPC